MLRDLTLTSMTCAVITLMHGAAQAIDMRTTSDARGTPFLALDFYSTADDASAIPWNLSEEQKQQVFAGVDYWAQRLRITPGQSPAVISVGTSAEKGVVAYANSSLTSDQPFGPTYVQAVLQDIPPPMPDPHGMIVIGQAAFDTMPYVPSIVPLNKTGINLPVVMVHEVAHALGLLNIVRNQTPDSENQHTLYYPSNLSAFTAGLRDDNGHAAQPGQDIWCTGCANQQGGNGVFDVRQNNGVFTGTHVREVLAGSMKGVPVSMFYENGTIDDNYMSHLELRNSLMSHQKYRNYTIMMEVELAVLQDIGYHIDRRDFFGSSIYGSHQHMTNTNGYFQRNADGTAYIPNTYNLATQGLGLHVYGSHNTVFQQADVLSAGAGSGGIRIDGEGNRMHILPGTRIHANGAFSRGVMLTYGKNHRLVQRGEVMATGDNGIAVSFDFGRNIAGDRDQRGSYIHTYNGAPGAVLAEIDGPLANAFDLTGPITGRYAAIYISGNAYVKTINIMQGAQITGDILSEYNQRDSHQHQRLTSLTLGMAADKDGSATSRQDPTFRLRYDGNIVGINNIALQVQGGNAEINGQHQLYRAHIAEGVTLSGNSDYTLHDAGVFTNAGTLVVSDGNHTSITGNYAQSPTGSLQVGVSGNKTLQNLVVNGQAALDGTLLIKPQRSWFANGTQVTSHQWIDANSVSGQFANVAVAKESPTLTATVMAQGSNTYRVTFSRHPHAYARLARNQAGQQVGAVLDTMVNNAGADIQPLFVALDFSGGNGHDVGAALTQLSPATYAEMFHGSLLRERHMNQLVSAGSTHSEENNGWNTFAIPFGHYYRHRAISDAVGATGTTYGVVFGGESRQHHWTMGVHGAVSSQTTTISGEATASGKSTALGAGAHLRFATHPYQGAHAFALARVGMDDSTLNRAVNVNGYRASPTAQWRGMTATTAIGGGWRMQTGKATSIGPILGLDYTVLQRPDVTESGTTGVHLHLDRTRVSALRAHVGAEWQSTWQTNAGMFDTSVKAAWHHELHDTAISQTACFVGYQGNGFGTNSTVISKDSASLQADLSYQLRKTMQLKAGLSATMWKDRSAQYSGAVSVNWQF